MRNQPSGWFFYACENLGAAAQPIATQGRSHNETRHMWERPCVAKGPQSGPKILNKKNFSDDWQVFEPVCKEIYTDMAVFSTDFRLSPAV